MKNIILSIFTVTMLAVSSFSFATSGGSTGGTPSIPCFKDGKMISSSLEIPKCEALGGTNYPDEAGVETMSLPDLVNSFLSLFGAS